MQHKFLKDNKETKCKRNISTRAPPGSAKEGYADDDETTAYAPNDEDADEEEEGEGAWEQDEVLDEADEAAGGEGYPALQSTRSASKKRKLAAEGEGPGGSSVPSEEADAAPPLASDEWDGSDTVAEDADAENEPERDGNDPSAPPLVIPHFESASAEEIDKYEDFVLASLHSYFSVCRKWRWQLEEAEAQRNHSSA